MTKTLSGIKSRINRHVFPLVEKIYNSFKAPKIKEAGTDFPELNEIIEHANERSDINEHLSNFFIAALTQKPQLIVELGVRSGESTFVLEKVAKLCNSTLISVDLDSCIKVSPWKDWLFVQSDDIAFAKEFPKFCEEKNIKQNIDLLFIDTSHFYEHTVQEIAAWFPLLAKKYKVVFHDTNLKNVYYRNDGSMGLAWDNERGVMRAIEEYFNTKFDETKDFKTIKDGVLITHYANCCGFTILEKLAD